MTSLEDMLYHIDDVAIRLESPFFKKSFKVRTHRDDICLRYLLLILEHRRGIFILLAADSRPPALSLLRPLTEAVLRLHIVMHGTEHQLESVKNDTYKTEFATEGELIDRVNEFQPWFGSLFGNTDIKDALHGFAHIGKHQLIRMSNETHIGPNYPDDEMEELMTYVTLLTFVSALSASKFLEWPEAIETSQRLFDEYFAETTGLAP